MFHVYPFDHVTYGANLLQRITLLRTLLVRNLPTLCQITVDHKLREMRQDARDDERAGLRLQCGRQSGQHRDALGQRLLATHEHKGDPLCLLELYEGSSPDSASSVDHVGHHGDSDDDTEIPSRERHDCPRRHGSHQPDDEENAAITNLAQGTFPACCKLPYSRDEAN